MHEKQKSTMEQLLPLFMQTAVGIIILLIVWLVITNLPMLKEIAFPLEFTLTELLAAAVLSIIVSMLVSFGLRMELRLGYLVTDFPQCGTMVKQFVFLIAILIAYFAFKPLAIPYMGDLDWIYHLLFLIFFLSILAILGSSIYRNMEELTELFTKTKYRGPSPSAALLCGKCGEKNAANTRFCSFCGEELPQPLKCGNCGVFLKPGAKFCAECGAVTDGTPAKGKPVQDAPSCDSCGTVLKPGGKFCPGCGAEVEKAAPVSQAENGNVEDEISATAAPVCVSCKAEIKPGAKFCPECGAAQE